MKKLDEMTVIEIIDSEAFEQQTQKIINEICSNRTAAARAPGFTQFKRGPIDFLRERKAFNAKALKDLYIGVLGKALKPEDFPSAVRSIIRTIGDNAFNRTVVELDKAEKAEVDSPMKAAAEAVVKKTRKPRKTKANENS